MAEKAPTFNFGQSKDEKAPTFNFGQSKDEKAPTFNLGPIDGPANPSIDLVPPPLPPGVRPFAEQSKGEEIYKLNNFNNLPLGVHPYADECLKRHEFIAQFVKEKPDSLTMFYATVAYYLATDQASAKMMHLAIDVVANQLKK